MILSRAPFRISLGGGGTDLPSYYSQYGGFILSAAINKYLFIYVNRPAADEFIRVLESGYLRRDAEPQSEVLLREVHALRQLVEQLQTTILACTRPASGRRRRTSASSKKTRS